MGVAGSGKSTVGKLLAEKLNWNFADADHFHPTANVEKMRAGIALTDQDREPWLEAMRESIKQWIVADQPTVLACSALKQSYRSILQIEDDVCIVYLKGTYDMFNQRLSERQGHFMKAKLLQSQFLALQEPEHAIVVDASKTPEQIVDEISRALTLS